MDLLLLEPNGIHKHPTIMTNLDSGSVFCGCAMNEKPTSTTAPSTTARGVHRWICRRIACGAPIDSPIRSSQIWHWRRIGLWGEVSEATLKPTPRLCGETDIDHMYWLVLRFDSRFRGFTLQKYSFQKPDIVGYSGQKHLMVANMETWLDLACKWKDMHVPCKTFMRPFRRQVLVFDVATQKLPEKLFCPPSMWSTFRCHIQWKQEHNRTKPSASFAY